MTSKDFCIYNNKFNSAFREMGAYNGTDGESKVQELYDLMFENLFNAKTERVLKCDCYFNNGKVVGLCEYKFDINMADRLELSGVIAQTVFYYKRIVEGNKYAVPNFIFIGDRNEALFFPASLLGRFTALEGVDYSGAASSAHNQRELVKAILNDEELHNSYFIVNPAECELVYIKNRAEAIASGKEYKIPVNEHSINRAFDAFMKCIDDVNVESNDLVSTFLDAIRNPEKVGYANGMIAVPGHNTVKVNKVMGAFLAHFDKPRTEDESRELTRLYDTLVNDVDRRKHGFFITPRIWTNLAHQYMSKVLGDNWEMNPNYIVWDNCAGTKSLTRDYRFSNLYLSTIDEGEFKATVDLSPEAKETFIFDFLNDPLTKLPNSLYNELNELRKHPEKKLVFIVNPPYGQAKGDGKVGTIDKGSTTSMIQKEMNESGCGAKCSDLFIQFNYRMAKLVEEFKLKDGQLVIGTFNNPTWMNGIGSTKFLNWYLGKMNYNGGFLFNASEFQGCSDNWGISFAMFTSSKGKNERVSFKHDLYENCEDEPKLIGEKSFVNPFGKQTMDEWMKVDMKKSGNRIVATKDSYLTPISTAKQKYNGGKNPIGIGYIESFGNIAKNDMSRISSAPADDNNTNIVTESNFTRACIAFTCRNLVKADWLNAKDNYFAPAPEIESSDEFKSWARDCVIYSCFSYQTSIAGTVDGESYDYKNHFCPFKKSEVLAIRGSRLMMNEVDEVPYVVSAGYTTNMSPEAEDVIQKYKELLIALEPFRTEFNKSHPELQLNRTDAGIVQYKGTKKTGFFAKVYAKKEYDAFTEAYRKLGEKCKNGIYQFGFLSK